MAIANVREYNTQKGQRWTVDITENGKSTRHNFTDKKEAREFAKRESQRIILDKYGDYVKPEEVREAITSRGISIREAAAICGYAIKSMHAIVEGRAKARRKKLGPLFDLDDNRWIIQQRNRETKDQYNYERQTANKDAREAMKFAEEIRSRYDTFPKEYLTDINGMLRRLDETVSAERKEIAYGIVE